MNYHLLRGLMDMLDGKRKRIRSLRVTSSQKVRTYIAMKNVTEADNEKIESHEHKNYY